MRYQLIAYAYAYNDPESRELFLGQIEVNKDGSFKNKITSKTFQKEIDIEGKFVKRKGLIRLLFGEFISGDSLMETKYSLKKRGKNLRGIYSGYWEHDHQGRAEVCIF